MKLKGNLAAATVVALSAASSQAVTVVNCTGPGPHQADIAAGIVAATAPGEDRIVEIHGTCLTTAGVQVLPDNLTIRGGGCDPFVNRTNAGSAFFVGGSGVTIEKLHIEAGVLGVNTANNGTIFFTPDNLTVRNNKIVSRANWCVQQAMSVSLGPFNDENPCDPGGPPIGIPTGWVIQDNDCYAPVLGLLMQGSNNVITGNLMVIGPGANSGIQNNSTHDASDPLSPPGGGNTNNYIANNVLHLDGTAGQTNGVLDIGINQGSVPEPDGCDIGGFNTYENNCIEITTTVDGVGFLISDTSSNLGPWNASGNDITLLTSPGGTGPHLVLGNFGSNNTIFAKNRANGAGDAAFQTFNGTESGNIIDRNKVGRGYTAAGGFFASDNGAPGANVYSKNDFCGDSSVGGGLITGPGAVDAGNNHSDRFCDLAPPAGPAQPCSASLPRSSNPDCAPFAPLQKSAPVSNPAPKAFSVDRQIEVRVVKPVLEPVAGNVTGGRAR